MTTEQRQQARAALITARDAAHEAICKLDQADALAEYDLGETDAIPGLCAIACAHVTTLVNASEQLAGMQAACQIYSEGAGL